MGGVRARVCVYLKTWLDNQGLTGATFALFPWNAPSRHEINKVEKITVQLCVCVRDKTCKFHSLDEGVSWFHTFSLHTIDAFWTDLRDRVRDVRLGGLGWGQDLFPLGETEMLKWRRMCFCLTAYTETLGGKKGKENIAEPSLLFYLFSTPVYAWP